MNQISEMECLLVICNMRDATSATELARALVEEQLAACVNILSPCVSIYRWQDKVEESRELPLLIKTTQASYTRLERFILEHHPYVLPEILAVPIVTGLYDYLIWVSQSVKAR